jgi:hypothetical protein
MIPNRENLREISIPITVASARVYLDGDLLRHALDRVEQGIVARCPAIDLIEVRLQKTGIAPFFTAWKLKSWSYWIYQENRIAAVADTEPKLAVEPPASSSPAQIGPAVQVQQPSPQQRAPAASENRTWYIGGVPVGLIFSLVLIIGGPILWFCRHRIARHFRDRTADKQIQWVKSVNEDRFGDATRQYEKERQEQLNKLYQSVPLNPPQRLRATMAFNTYKIPTFETEWYEGLSAEKQTGFQTVHSVDLMLELSEEERTIVIKNDLHTIVLEDKARYTKRDLERMRYDDKLMAESHKGRSFDDQLVKEISKQTYEVVRELKSEERDSTHLGDYLIIPYVRTFDHPHEAKRFADTLTTKILPQIKEIIDSYREHKSVKTLEF